MGEEGKAWTSLCHCLLLETVPLKTKKKTQRVDARFPLLAWNKHSKVLRCQK